jgi:hypothetical protein
MYTLQEAKHKLGYANSSYIRKLIAAKKVRAIKKGNTWIITQDEMNRLMALRAERFN